jgi:hypothetical protein
VGRENRRAVASTRVAGRKSENEISKKTLVGSKKKFACGVTRILYPLAVGNRIGIFAQKKPAK